MLPISNQTIKLHHASLFPLSRERDQRMGAPENFRNAVRSIFKPIFFPFFLLFRRDSIEMETRNDTNWTYPREKAHQTLIDRPISECGTEMRGFLRFV